MQRQEENSTPAATYPQDYFYFSENDPCEPPQLLQCVECQEVFVSNL